MTRVLFGFDIVPIGDDPGTTGLEVAFQAGRADDGGQPPGMEIVVKPISTVPGKDCDGWNIGEGLDYLGKLFGVDAIGQIGNLNPAGPWGDLFGNVQILPTLRVEPVGENPAIELDVQLFKTGAAHDSGISIGGEIVPGISFEPNITVYDLVAGYSKQHGLDLKARVLVHSTDDKRALRAPGAPAPAGKPQLVSYPFPLPDQNEKESFKLVFLGLGQRFAPKDIDLNAPDPLADAFDKLEKTFTSDDPATILTTLVQDYYQPEVGWFFALHLDVRGFTVRAVLADPVLYGLEITCGEGMFTGLLVEILYQKIGADLGVFYGKIVLPDNLRQIQVGAGSGTIPSFEIWIYTNGDFKIAVGWPLGPDSFSLQVLIFTGSAGFYFGKLRSGDNPTGRNQPQVEYNPILVFGLALKIGIGRSFSKGPISAEASLTLQGVFQGLLAWKAADKSSGGINGQPDYYWFSASVTLAGVVQGSVDLGIISATVCIKVWATVATAFETALSTVVDAQVGVEVEVSIKIVFFTIHISFSATLDLSFTLIDNGPNYAKVDGPSDPNLRAFIPNPQSLPRTPPALRGPAESNLRSLEGGVPPPIGLSFILQPSVPYSSGGAGSIGAVATLLIPAPDPTNPVAGTDFEVLADLVAPWLTTSFGAPDGTWKSVAANLGGGGAPAPAGFESGLAALLQPLTFEITGVDLTKTGTVQTMAIFPMFDSLSLTAGGQTWNFGTQPLTYLTYPAALAAYFAALSALTPKDPATVRAALKAETPDGPSLAHLLYVNWFLALARQIAAAMADLEKKNGGTLPPNSLPTTPMLASIAGMLSRMALHGTRLPDPAVVHAPGDPITEAMIHALYDLDHQQFTAAANVPVAASLTLTGSGGPTITFAAGDSADALLPAAAVPPEPNPGWSSAGTAGIVVTAIDPLSEGELVLSMTARTPGPASLYPGGAAAPPVQLLTLPPTATPLIAKGGLKGMLRIQPCPKAAATAFAPGLLIPLGLRRVAVTPASDLDPGDKPSDAPTPVPRWSKDVYELVGTDDATRELLEQALDDPNFLVRRIVPLTFQSSELTADALDPQQIVLLKSNLSTTSQPNALAAPMMLLRRLAAGDDLGPVSATLGDQKNFLRLVWEASVVHTSGFYLRYLDSAGNGLPDTLFEKDVARFWLWLDLGDASATGTPIPAYASSLVISDTGDAAKATQYLWLAQGDTVLTAWHPSFPPGCAGVEMTWNNPPVGDGVAYSQKSVEALYQMIELQLGDGGGAYDATLWSTPLSPVHQDKDAQLNVIAADYRQVVPVWHYLTAPPPDGIASPYPAVSHPAALNFRVSDVYGNVLSDPTRAYGASFPVVYNDPLLAPASWPGCRAAYDIAKSGNGPPTLTIVITYEPKTSQQHAARLMVSGGVALAAEADASMLATWTTIRQQVHDTNFQAIVSSTLYGDPDANDVWPAVGDAADTLAQLRNAVETLYQAVAGSGTDETSATIVLPLAIAQIVARPSDIFPLGVRLTLARHNVDAGVTGRLPAVGRIEALLAPHLQPVASSDSKAAAEDDPPPPSPLVAWARAVESALAGYDGAGSLLKLAQRPLSAADDAGTGPGLFAVRLSKGAGISVTSDNAAKPAFFTMEPFSLTLQYGQADITTWDSALAATQSKSSAASVDPDLLAQFFLTSFDRLMAPDLAAGIARIDSVSFAAMMSDKATVASVLSKRLIPIFTDQTVGDLDEATTQFEQSLLAQLSNAYTTAAIAQTQMAVSVAGAAEAGATIQPRLYGGLATVAGDDATASYTLTSPKLALDRASPSPWLTFLVTVKAPEDQNFLDLAPVWTLSHIEHDFEPGEKTYGYLPSGWLKFVLPDQDPASPLNISLGDVNVPVPLRRYPMPPALISQIAERPPASGVRAAASDDPIQDEIRAAMQWPFTLNLRKEEQAAQDDLWVTSTFNQPIDWTPQAPGSPGPLTGLTVALLQFQAGFVSVAPLLGQLETGGPLAPKLIGILRTLVSQVVAALRPPRVFFEPMPVERLIWVLRYAKNSGPVPTWTLFGRVDPVGAATPLLFPTINGTAYSGQPVPALPHEAPDGNAWMKVSYAFPDEKVPNPLFMAIDGLDLLVDQTVVGSAYITRNADLGATVNPKLVYRTPEVSFSNVIVPFVEIGRTLTGPPSGPPLEQLLASVLMPFANVGAGIGPDRTVRLSAAYNYPIATPAGGGDPLMATLPALLNAGEPLGADPAPLAQAFADALRQWGKAVPLPRTGASFSISVSLFVDVSTGGAPQLLPLLTLDRIDLNVPPGWPAS